MKKEQLKAYSRLLPLVLLAVAAAAIGATYASTKQTVSVENELEAHSTDVEIDEKFTPNPDEHNAYTKKVRFTNKGTSSVFLRMSFVEYWEKGMGTKKLLLPNQVKVTSGENVAMQDVMKKLVTKVDTDGQKKTHLWTSAYMPLSFKWEKRNDGWYYYKFILKPGTSTDEILSSVQLNPQLDPSNELHAPYFESDANYHLYFQVEAVQASDSSNTLNCDEVNGNATETSWGIRAVTNIANSSNNVQWGTTTTGGDQNEATNE